MKMSSSTTQLVVALSLCLLLLGFSYSAEAAARPITDVAGAAINEQKRCDLFKVHCAEDAECTKLCQSKGYGGGFCLAPPASSAREEKIDVNRFAVVTLFGCCCPRQ